MKKYLLIISLFVFGPLMAQEEAIPQLSNKSITIPSPETAQLGRYALQPPNISNGKPQQTIQLFEVRENTISFSSSLFYNYSGLQPREDTPCLGLGWGITEGFIMKTEKHVDDNDPNLIKRFSDFGNDLYAGEEFGYGINSNIYDPNPEAFGLFSYTRNRLYQKLYDGQPDLYIYNFNGYEGRFVVINGEPVNLIHNDLIISGNGTGNFEVKTPDGIMYYFTLMEKTTIIGMNSYGNSCGSNPVQTYSSGHPRNTGWKLTRIYNPNTTDYINLTYRKDNYNHTRNWFDPQSVTFIGEKAPFYNSTHYQYEISENRSGIMTGYEKSYLESIESNTQKIEFEFGYYSRLKNIKIYAKTDLIMPVKTIDFSHGSFNNDNDITKLISVRIKGGQQNEFYQFNYINENFISSLISKESKSIDHWGYFNGKNNSTLYPQELERLITPKIPSGSYMPPFPFSFANRTPDIGFSKTYALEKVTFPTGGYVKYEYESSRGKGIRVKHMEENDGTKSTHRYYDYGSMPDLTPHYEETEYYEHCPNIGRFLLTFRHYVSYSVFPMGSFNEYIDLMDFYPTVTEFFGSTSGSEGKVVYNFDFSQDNYKTLLKKKITKGRNDQEIRIEEYQYEDIRLRIIEFWRVPVAVNTGSMIDGAKLDRDGLGLLTLPHDELPDYPYILGEIETSVDNLNVYWNRLKSKKITENGVTTMTDYKYRPAGLNRDPEDCNLTEISSSQSDGKVTKTAFKYPKDFKTEGIFSEMISKNMLKLLVEQIDSVDTSRLKSLKLSYAKFNNNTLIAPSRLVEANGPDLKTAIEYHQYDEYGNPVHITENEIYEVVYLWGYKGWYPIAEIRNATYGEVRTGLGVEPKSISTAKTPDMARVEGLRSIENLKKAHINTYTYKPLVGVTSITDPAGKTTHYDYDNLNRLKEVFIYNNNTKEILESYEYNYVNQ